MDLQKETRRLMKNRHYGIMLKQITEDTGLSGGWLSKLVHRKLKNPDPERVKRLHDYLLGKPKPRGRKPWTPKDPTRYRAQAVQPPPFGEPYVEAVANLNEQASKMGLK